MGVDSTWISPRPTSRRGKSTFYQGLRQRQIPIYTSEYVLDEMISLLFRLQRRFSEAVHFVEGITGIGISRIYTY